METREAMFAGYNMNYCMRLYGVDCVVDGAILMKRPAKFRAHLFDTEEVFDVPNLLFNVNEGVWKPSPLYYSVASHVPKFIDSKVVLS